MVNVAKQVVRTSLNLTDQDVLEIDCWSHVTGLASQIAAEAYKVGADAQISYLDDGLWRSWFEMDEKYIARKSPISAALAETITAYVSLWRLEDGIVDANDIARGHLQSSLPSGFVDIAPLETTGDGDVTFPSTPLWGKMIRNLRFTFSGGRLVDYKADKNVEAFANYFKASSGEKDRIGSLTIGLNPRASYLGGFVDHFVAGAVTIGLGGNQDIGGANRSSFDFGATLQKATVTADGMSVVEAGKLSK